MTIDDTRIDALDAQVLDLLNERARLATEIWRRKADRTESFFAPAREKQVIQGLLSRNGGPLPERAVRAIYREIISACRALEKPLRVAYWGPPASFTHVASLHKFGSLSDYIACDTVADVFATVSKKQSDYGVVPIENSTEGIVEYTLDTFNESELIICAEVYVEIAHNLLSLAASLDEVGLVYTGAQPLAQCRAAEHHAGCRAQEVNTTARGAACRRNPALPPSAAMAAEVYHLRAKALRTAPQPHPLPGGGPHRHPAQRTRQDVRLDVGEAPRRLALPGAGNLR